MTAAHVLNGLMNYISKDKQNRKQFASTFTNVLLSSWQQLSSWWSKESSDDLKLSTINLLKKALVLEPKVLVLVIIRPHNLLPFLKVDAKIKQCMKIAF